MQFLVKELVSVEKCISSISLSNAFKVEIFCLIYLVVNNVLLNRLNSSLAMM